MPSILPFAGARRGALLVVLCVLLVSFAAVPARAATGAARTAALRAQAAALFERRAHASREGGVALPPLQAELQALAQRLEAAHLDSLACDARWYSANLLSRMAKRPECDRELLLSIADAVRARDEQRVMRGRSWQADLRVQTDPPLAIRTSEETIPRLRALGWDQLLGNAYSTEARAYTELGRASDAFVAGRVAVAHYAAAKDVPGQLWAMSQVSQSLRYMGRHAEARATTDSAVAMARQAHVSRPLSRALLERASIHRTSGELPEALRDVNEALAEDRIRGDVATSTTSRVFRARIYMAMDRPRDCEADMDSLLHSPAVQQSMNALIQVVSLRARALARLSRAAEADTQLAALAERYERQRAALASDQDRASSGEHAAELYTTWTRVRLAQGRTEDAWRVCERGRAVALRERLGHAAVPPLAELRARLAATHTVLLEYDLMDPGMGNVFRLSAEGVSGQPLERDVSQADLDAAMDAWASLAAGHAPDSAVVRVAQALLADAAPHLGASVERLVVVPPARMEKVPFEALPLPGGGMLGERWPVTYVPSAAVWLALDRRAVPPRGLTVLADPSVDSRQPAITALAEPRRGAVLRALPGAREEARRLAGPGATLLVGPQATLRRLAAAPAAAVLHLATHALDDPRSPGLGGLVLAGRPALLGAAAVESLAIAADLVTLSGCATMGSTAYSSEGTFGLARAFLVGGARSVLGTRWDVSDRAAERYMRTFYDALRSGQPRDASARLATQALRREGYPPRDVWAFLLTGAGDRPVGAWPTVARGIPAPVRK